ncbi:MAG TPA: hypothetical protein VD862_03815 [Candidatus Paceibacterota bacterium]|nr:hypothetical protein [Candidatus Paceibacterota bacterium]
MNRKLNLAIAVLLLAAASAGYYLGYDHGYEKAAGGEISSFEDCAGRYPVGESYPRQCWTPDGRRFVEDIRGDGIACPADAKLCPDGSYVGRTGPNCEFAPCK